MRENITPQLQLGEIDIHNIQFNPRSRDDIHQLLTGLKYLYVNKDTREKIFTILEDLTPKNISTKR